MANYPIMAYAKNNQDPTPGSPMLGLSVGPTLLYSDEILKNKMTSDGFCSWKLHNKSRRSFDWDLHQLSDSSNCSIHILSERWCKERMDFKSDGVSERYVLVADFKQQVFICASDHIPNNQETQARPREHLWPPQ
ncbi:hypothetical protein PoB_002986400 [Plakobranchus ocellatus]|uniref:Uncharacterized protein n=1 Tax=Plakobranchus ocellatus TaxID=259542 RepID=A0AAV4AAS5_9GAST|nr:hypothetical protein PoB_002986400 [Plakobranchus ocellatus]